MRLAIGLLIIPAALAVATGPAMSGRGEAPSGSRAFSLDGRRFVVEGPSRGSQSLVASELIRRGFDVGRMTDDLRSAIGPAPVEPLREESVDHVDPPLPCGLEAEHVLRLESTAGPVEIAFGRVGGPPGDILRRLRVAGWECRETDARDASAAVARMTGRKEASIVLLDKAEGRFLAIRRAVR